MLGFPSRIREASKMASMDPRMDKKADYYVVETYSDGNPAITSVSEYLNLSPSELVKGIMDSWANDNTRLLGLFSYLKHKKFRGVFRLEDDPAYSTALTEDERSRIRTFVEENCTKTLENFQEFLDFLGNEKEMDPLIILEKNEGSSRLVKYLERRAAKGY
jgi:hypothetical protein